MGIATYLTDAQKPLLIDTQWEESNNKFLLKKHLFKAPFCNNRRSHMMNSFFQKSLSRLVYARNQPTLTLPLLYPHTASDPRRLPNIFSNFRIVSKPPYEVSETGWGEFEIQIRIYFNDLTEKPVTFYHLLKLFHTNEAVTSQALIQVKIPRDQCQ